MNLSIGREAVLDIDKIIIVAKDGTHNVIAGKDLKFYEYESVPLIVETGTTGPNGGALAEHVVGNVALLTFCIPDYSVVRQSRLMIFPDGSAREVWSDTQLAVMPPALTLPIPRKEAPAKS